jgi:hypothetical protein
VYASEEERRGRNCDFYIHLAFLILFYYSTYLVYTIVEKADMYVISQYPPWTATAQPSLSTSSLAPSTAQAVENAGRLAGSISISKPQCPNAILGHIRSTVSGKPFTARSVCGTWDVTSICILSFSVMHMTRRVNLQHRSTPIRLLHHEGEIGQASTGGEAQTTSTVGT